MASYPGTGPHSPLTTHHSPLTTHHSPLTTHHSPLTTHHSPLTTHHSPLTTHHSPLTTHQSPNLQCSADTSIFAYSPEVHGDEQGRGQRNGHAMQDVKAQEGGLADEAAA